VALGRFHPAVPPDQDEEAKQQRGSGREQRHRPCVARERREQAGRASEEQRQPAVGDEPGRAFVARPFDVVDGRLLAVRACPVVHACTIQEDATGVVPTCDGR